MQFERNEDGSWQYLPEHISKSYTLKDKDYKNYVNRFNKILIFNAVLGGIALLLLVFWILYFKASMVYLIWGVFTLFLYYYSSYHNIFEAFYSPQKKSKYHHVIGFLFPTIIALILVAYYFNWSINLKGISASIEGFSNRIGLTALVAKYPFISFGIFIAIFMVFRFFFGVHSIGFRPATKRRRKQIEEERDAPPKETSWEKDARESYEKLSKKEKKKLKKEMKKQGKVFPKKYKGETES